MEFSSETVDEVSIHTHAFGKRTYQVRRESTPDLVLWLMKRPWSGVITVEFGA